MKEINILSSKVFNRIAAGEVVERPASVVKELVENSIDAGAKEIVVSIINGGITSISVIDDGFGIAKSQLHKALLPHATSKISKVEDLDCISTLGFRGEALASIASVSKITIKSKPNDQDFGAQIYAEGENKGEITDCAATKGTEIIVNNLFFNTPVRAKFLKSERSEEGEITQIMARFILGHPEIAFKYLANNNVVFQSFGEGIESAFVSVYGVKTLKDCFFVNADKNGVSINGYIGKQYFSKPNRTYQTIFLNGRYIVDGTISSAITNAYSSYLMKRQYPFYVLNINVPNEFVDVNVHPNKTQVRFMNNQVVYGAIYSVISKVLDGQKEALSIITSDKTVEIEKPFIKPSENTSDIVRHNNENPFAKLDFNDSTPAISHTNIKPEIKEDKTSEANDIFLENKAFIEQLEKQKQAERELKNSQTEIAIDEKLTYIGQGLKTFLIYELGKDLLFVDQHALHERMLFDKLMAKNNLSDTCQPLLVPYIVDLNAIEYNFILDKIWAIKELGIDIEEFGDNSFKISSLPIYLADMNLKKFFDQILIDINSLKNITAKDLLKEKIAQKACKSAIKSGDSVTESEIEVLTDYIKKDLGLKCPHGRPVAIRITRTEIDKWFKRIV